MGYFSIRYFLTKLDKQKRKNDESPHLIFFLLLAKLLYTNLSLLHLIYL